MSAGILSMLSATAFATPQEQTATPDAKQETVLNLAKQVRKQMSPSLSMEFSTTTGPTAKRTLQAGLTWLRGDEMLALSPDWRNYILSC